jgi:hypothetical protein
LFGYGTFLSMGSVASPWGGFGGNGVALLRELIDIPTLVSECDFVVKARLLGGPYDENSAVSTYRKQAAVDA